MFPAEQTVNQQRWWWWCLKTGRNLKDGTGAIISPSLLPRRRRRPAPVYRGQDGTAQHNIIIVASCGGRYAPQVFSMVMAMARPSDTYIDHCWPPLAMFSSLRVLGAFQAKWQRQWQNCGHSGWLHLDSFSNNSLPKMWNYDPRARAAGGFSLGPQSSVEKKPHFLSTSKTAWIFWI